ncbi:MAG: BatD family protein [Candidatus Marinimicrobia bacterium]|nr:BatD family protein [Candidatus Neomarinimicrobiota bacterium]MCF7828962.1 BatD family protein [Candidatus Neomarinimicrobiota bacterium]MCF7879922.1 BatD family protein [Candidatus Neomarinimicrobiota bacterium]
MTTTVDTTAGLIGDLFHLELSVEHPEGAQVSLPQDIQTLGEFSVRDIETNPGKTTTDITYSLAVYDTGRYTIPSIKVSVQPPDTGAAPISLESATQEIMIYSTVPPDAQELRDIKPLMDLPARIPWLWIGIGSGLLIAGILGWFWWRRRETEEEPEMTPEERRQSAHERAYKRLREIERADYPGKGAMKRHFSDISQTIRAYFEDRYFIPALEMTSTEVLRAFPENQLTPEIYNEVSDLLTTSDLVKFAKYQPSKEEADRVLEEGFDIVDHTKIEISEMEEVEDEEDPEVSEKQQDNTTQQQIAEVNKGESP